MLGVGERTKLKPPTSSLSSPSSQRRFAAFLVRFAGGGDGGEIAVGVAGTCKVVGVWEWGSFTVAGGCWCTLADAGAAGP
jgi:hypothetical protein